MENRFDKIERADDMAESEVDGLYDAAKELPVEQRAELVRKLLGNSEGTTLSFGNSSVGAETVYQINLTSREEMALVIEAIAGKIRSDSSPPSDEDKD